MNRTTPIALLLALAAAPALLAVNAHPASRLVVQPSGDTLRIRLCGDERCNYFVVEPSGRTILFNRANRTWEYARLSGDTLATTGIAVGASSGPASPAASIPSETVRPKPRVIAPPEPLRLEAPLEDVSPEGTATRASLADLSAFRGLVVLVEYQDTPFSRTDARQIFADMTGKAGYTGFRATDGTTVSYTGSLYDYFNDNTSGRFRPQFDIYGPVGIPYDATYARQANNAQTLIKAALRQLDDSVDFARYDADGDGTVDMAYFIFSGGGSNYADNDMWLLWPHAGTLTDLTLDGVAFGRYACSTELYGAVESKVIDGIGTMVHEFSHVLGLPDLYDIDGSGSGGTADSPGVWSVMASGSYLNKGRTPAGFSIVERELIGLCSPAEVKAGSNTLQPVNTSGTGLRLSSGSADEYFLLEARKLTRWDLSLPGAGMLVWRVDKSDPTLWTSNRVNTDPVHTRLTLIRAVAKASGNAGNSARDPFPGSGSVTALGNSGTPSLCSWSGIAAPWTLSAITRAADGSVSFTATAVASALDGVGADASGSNSFAAADASPDARYYDLRGTRVDPRRLTPGLYVEQRQGKTRLVVIR
jgi:M6 family metalloprotease-like protein